MTPAYINCSVGQLESRIEIDISYTYYLLYIILLIKKAIKYINNEMIKFRKTENVATMKKSRGESYDK